MAGVAIHDLHKSYGSLPVMHGVSFDVKQGEFVALVGPSGCGKSTLLRMIAGLEDITGGTVSIAGKVVNEVEPKERDIAMVFQNYALYPHMNVRENMAFSLKLRGGQKRDIDTRVLEAAAILGMSDYLDRYPRHLSGGQRQRVAMGRAIVRHPAVFLFDEPLSNLDAALRVQMRAEIRGLHDRLGTTSIYVTHDQVEAMTMADRIVVMRAGKVEQFGLPLELYDRPANAFVGGFIGSPAMNQFTGRVENGHFQAAEIRLSLPDHLPDGPVICGLRPEHVDIAVHESAAIKARVERVETTGATMFINAKVGDQILNVVLNERQAITKGDVIGLMPKPGALHLFHSETGVRLG